MKNEPIVLWGTLGPIVSAFLLALLNRYMPDMGSELINTTVVFVVAVLPIVFAIYMARSKAFGPVTVANDYVKKDKGGASS